MLFRTSALRFRLVVCVASVALASGLAVSPANAGSKRTPWIQQGGTAAVPGEQVRPNRKSGRGQQPAQVRAAPRPWPAQPAAPANNSQKRKRGKFSRYVAPAPQPPQSASQGNRRGHDRRYIPPAAPPGHADRDRRASGNPRYTAPPPSAGNPGRDRRASGNPRYTAPPPATGHADRGRPRHRDDDRRHGASGGPHYKHKRRHQETHVTHGHVQRHYYYRTSSRHYYYYYGAPRPYAYPVYYLVPYHVHTTPGYHNHGEEANYCEGGYTQGGVYRGGAYTRGASHQPGATIIGGILGAAVGSQVGKGKGQLVAVGVGTVIGALIGSDMGRAMDKRDQAYATGSFGHAMESAPTCTTITWNNQQTGNHGSITPTNTYEPEPGRYCREFQQQVVIGGELQDAYGTACRQPDGSWEIVAEQS